MPDPYELQVEITATSMLRRYGWCGAVEAADGYLTFVRHDTLKRGKEAKAKFWEEVKTEILRRHYKQEV